MKQLEPKNDMPKPDDDESFTLSELALMIWRLALLCCGGFLVTAPMPVAFQLVGLLCMLGAIIGE